MDCGCDFAKKYASVAIIAELSCPGVICGFAEGAVGTTYIGIDLDGASRGIDLGAAG